MADFSAFVPFRVYRTTMYGSLAVLSKSPELCSPAAFRNISDMRKRIIL